MKKTLSLLCCGAAMLPAAAAYDINFPDATQIADREGRALNAICMNGDTVAVGQAEDKLLYHDLSSDAIFEIAAGEMAVPGMDWNGSYMHGYLYVDFNADGVFTPETELVSYSYRSGKNSLGLGVKDNCGVGLNEFVVPVVAPGDYRMRYIVDWDATEPGGRAEEGNSIVKNAGAIVDATLRVSEAAAPETQYAVNYEPTTVITHAGRRLGAVKMLVDMFGAQNVAVTQREDKLLYYDRTDCVVTLPKSTDVRVNFDWDGTWMNGYVYLDRSGNGDFSAHVSSAGTAVPGSDLLSYSHIAGKNSLGQTTKGESLDIPAFQLPAELEVGKQYRMRVKIDWDSADPAGSESILTNGGAIVDFTVAVAGDDIKTADVTLMPLNGMVTLSDGAPVPETFACGYDLTIKAQPSLPGFTTDHIIVRHGADNALEDTKIALDADGVATIPGSMINSDIIIYALFEETPDSEWTKIWGDEFNADAINLTTWSYHPRYSATWNRYIAQGEGECQQANTFGNGYYNAWCLPTDKTLFPEEEQPMISGAIYTGGKFEFHYGRIEVRAKTNPFVGNFPAFWLMPATNAEGGWPKSGEIDIWEQIDTSQDAHSTVHTGWTGWRNYCGWTEGPKQGSPRSTNSVRVDNMAAWHYYALEWDAEELRWYVDGKHTFTYKNMHYSEPGTNYTEQICWPFYKDFYVILNQSVGNGSWAKWPDFNHSYLTQFDYVRCYQKKGENTYKTPLSGNGDDPDFYVPLGQESIDEIISNGASDVNYYDLSGRRVENPTRRGVYIMTNGSKSSKIIR